MSRYPLKEPNNIALMFFSYVFSLDKKLMGIFFLQLDKTFDLCDIKR
jgi:hypothetical protein